MTVSRSTRAEIKDADATALGQIASWYSDAILSVDNKPLWYRRAFLIGLPITGPIWFALLFLWILAILWPLMIYDVFLRSAIKLWRS